MAYKLGTEKVFPSMHYDINGRIDKQHAGISKRFYAACAAMQGLLAGQAVYKDGIDAEWTAKTAFKCADKLLEQEDKE